VNYCTGFGEGRLGDTAHLRRTYRGLVKHRRDSFDSKIITLKIAQ